MVRSLFFIMEIVLQFMYLYFSADNCEACKVLATELDLRLTETGKSHDVLEIG